MKNKVVNMLAGGGGLLLGSLSGFTRKINSYI